MAELSLDAIPSDAVGLKLYRFKAGSDDPIPCEAICFPGGASAVHLILRRAAISGRVEIEGEIKDHFADILDAEQSIVATVALDAKSYRALKTKWMPCKTDPVSTRPRTTAEQEA